MDEVKYWILAYLSENADKKGVWLKTLYDEQTDHFEEDLVKFSGIVQELVNSNIIESVKESASPNYRITKKGVNELKKYEENLNHAEYLRFLKRFPIAQMKFRVRIIEKFLASLFLITIFILLLYFLWNSSWGTFRFNIFNAQIMAKIPQLILIFLLVLSIVISIKNYTLLLSTVLVEILESASSYIRELEESTKKKIKNVSVVVIGLILIVMLVVTGMLILSKLENVYGARLWVQALGSLVVMFIGWLSHTAWKYWKKSQGNNTKQEATVIKKE